MSGPRSGRTRLRRGSSRAEYAREPLLEILDAGMVAHVGVMTPEGPIVLPMAYGRTDEHLYLHGAAGNAIARSPFRHSMNYRSVVVRGTATEVEDDAKSGALRLMSDHVVETWETGRLPTDAEVRSTLVLRLPLSELSGKVRAGGPTDLPEDLEGPHWAGHVPIESRWGAAVGAEDLVPGIDPPPAVAELEAHRLP